MTTLNELRVTLGELRDRRDVLRVEIETGARTLAATVDEGERGELLAMVEQLRQEDTRLRENEARDVAIQLDPRQWIGQIDGNVPILLFPLRIQTRFANNAAGRELLVRVFPDEISVQSHDPTLTEAERDAGTQFWAAPAESEDPGVPSQRTIWRGMADRFGLRRAQWIRRAADPAAPAAPAAGAPLRIADVRTLPERLVFRFFGPDNRLLAEIAGGPIADGLAMGFDRTRDALGFAREGTDFEYPPELLWQVDFEAAVQAGMAVRVPMGALDNVQRIERLVVLGVRLGTDPQRSAERLENLLDAHRYAAGFSILPQGTPTNVTSDAELAVPENPDALLDRLRGPGAFEGDGRETLYEDECDGLRLAHALGISTEVLRFVDHADQRDGSQAIAMKRALWAGTFGYYAQQMLAPFFDPPAPGVPEPLGDRGERFTAAARFHFTHFVFGRGPLPAIRVGDQPYGILPVSGDMLQVTPNRLPAWGEPYVDAFEDSLHQKLLILARAWVDAARDLRRAGPGVDADKRLLDALSLQASTAELHAEQLVGLEYIENVVDFEAKGVAVKLDQYKSLLNDRRARFEKAFPGLFERDPAIFNLSFFGAYWKEVAGGVLALDRSLAPLLEGDVIDNLPYSESAGISEAYPNYLELLASRDFADVRRGFTRVEDGKTVPVTAALYLVARHSYLYEHAFTAMRLHHHLQTRAWSDFKEKEMYNTLHVFDRTHWDTLEIAAHWQVPGVINPVSVLELIRRRDTLRQFRDWKTYFGDVDEVLRALKVLAGVPTAALERLFAEHLDLAGYRLDAWLTGFVYQRLLAVRVWRDADRGNRLHPMYPFRLNGPLLRYDLNHGPLEPYASGIQLGAYGWIEGLQADGRPTPVDDLPADLTPANGRPVTRDADNYGLVQAPSLNQATTAAVLRAASVTEPDTTAFNIDLSSARVRDALFIMEGVRNGQAPAALLGYQFERRLREVNVTLLRHLPALRDTFPMPRVQDVQGDAVEGVPARDVVNGLRVVQAFRDGSLDAKLAFVADLAERASLVATSAAVAGTFDACSDLMLAESVHHAALGNDARAGSIVTAAGEFMHVPDEFDVIRTPRTGTGLTHRVIVAMNDTVPAAVPLTPRARLAPVLNEWVSSITGPLSALGCEIVYAFTENADGGEDEEEAGGAARHAVTLDALGLEPLDVVYLLDDSAASELAERVDLVARQDFERDHPGVSVKKVSIELFAAPAAIRAVGEMIPLITSLRALLGAGRPATQRDLVAPQFLHGRSQEAMDAIDLPELAGRVSDLQLAFEAALAGLDPDLGLDAGGLAAALITASAFGVAAALPVVTDTLETLTTRAARTVVLMQARLDAAVAKWTRPTPPPVNTLGSLTEVVTELLGSAVPLMPRILLTDDLASAALSPDDPSPERLEDWLFTAALVRESAARLQRVRVLAAATAADLAAMRLFQWPADQKQWIAAPNAIDPEKVRDYMAIVVQPDADIDVAQPIVGFVIDEWHELLPNQTETTGISFHYDAPNAEPPQSLLLAVSERQQASHGNWTWDELTRAIDHTFLMAQMRAVGTDELRRTPLDTVLPATMLAEAATAATISTSLFANISLTVAEQVSAVWSKT